MITEQKEEGEMSRGIKRKGKGKKEEEKTKEKREKVTREKQRKLYAPRL